MGPKKVIRASSSSNTKQLTQLPKHEREDPIEGLLKDSPPHPESSAKPPQALTPPTLILEKAFG
ncbi:hypothetical protein ACLOJK_014305, partial [Asimina triloba]